MTFCAPQVARLDDFLPFRVEELFAESSRGESRPGGGGPTRFGGGIDNESESSVMPKLTLNEESTLSRGLDDGLMSDEVLVLLQLPVVEAWEESVLILRGGTRGGQSRGEVGGSG
mmetsp:Transcript_16747/g.42810  ORF Transcript_16747/g.42810 Transcript_16747/m.42810 type:complete len:115 (-) Transcript_16747:166-510(-)